MKTPPIGRYTALQSEVTKARLTAQSPPHPRPIPNTALSAYFPARYVVNCASIRVSCPVVNRSMQESSV